MARHFPHSKYRMFEPKRASYNRIVGALVSYIGIIGNIGAFSGLAVILRDKTVILQEKNSYIAGKKQLYCGGKKLYCGKAKLYDTMMSTENKSIRLV